MRNMNYNGHKNNQMRSKRGERQTFWDILNAGYEHQLLAKRQMALFIWMTNISRKRFGSRVENKKHNEVIKWKHFPCYWPFVRGIHKGNPWVTGGVPSQRPVTRGSVFSLICAWTVEQTMETPVRHHHAHYDVTVMFSDIFYRIHWTHWEGNSVIVSIISSNGFAQ